MGRRAVVLALLMGLWTARGIGGEVAFTDDFAGYPAGSDGSPAWETTGIEWEVRDGQFVASGKARSFALCAREPVGRAVEIAAVIRPRKATGTDWKTAGVAIVLDERNYWHFALVEGPDKAGRKHFVELSEMLDGTWLSQYEPATRLTEAESVNPNFGWEHGQTYSISISLSESEVSGSLRSLDGRVLASKRFKLDNRAVKAGRPALTCGGLEVAFDTVAAHSGQPVPEPEKPKTAFLPFTQAGRVPQPDEPKGKATGFFHVEAHDGRWWVIDPKGRPFYVVGTDHANYRVHWCEKLGYAPYHRNMAARFKGDESAWAAETADRLLAWGFNSLGANHSPSLRGRGLAWMGFVSCGAGFSDVSDLCPKVHWTGFPNVFDPRFPRYCELRARQVCGPHRDDPWLLGHFIDNELEWYGKEGNEWSLVDEVFKKPAGHAGKQALVAFLKERYPKVEQLNAAWGTAAASYEAIAASTEPLRHKTEQGRADKLAFLRLIAERYFAITSAAIRKHDPNHMVLGARFAGWFPPGVGEAAGRHCDIFTINCYRWVDLETGVVRDFEADLKRWHAEAKRPFMITEWSFPALDSGLPCKHGAGQRFDTQDQRAQAFTIFQKQLFATPFMVGSNFFMWVDEPALGISSTFPEDSNYGLVNEQGEPYKPLVEAATKLHPQVYAIHAGGVPELSVVVADKPLRAVVTNRGRVAARTEIETVLLGQRQRKTIEVAPGGSTEVPLAWFAKDYYRTIDWGHVLVVVDPDGRLPEARRDDNSASLVVAPTGAEGSRQTEHGYNLEFLVVNPTGDEAQGRPVLPLSHLPPAVRQSVKAGRVGFHAPYIGEAFITSQPSGFRWPAQVDNLGNEGEVVFLSGQLKPFVAYWQDILFSNDAHEMPKEGWPVKFATEGGGWKVHSGILQLIKERPGGNAFDKVLLKGKELGLFVPVIWQDVGQGMWPKPDSAKILGASNGHVRLAFDIEFELKAASGQKVITEVDKAGKFAEAARRPGAFKTCYRFYVYHGQPWFGARFLWLENTDTREWGFQGYFHYALSNLGGDARDDEVGGPGVPMYYAGDRAVSWFDAKAKLHYGIIQGRPGNFDMVFWKDPSGAQHADVRRVVKKRLKPGERYAEPQPTAYVFGAEGGPGKDAWMPVADAIRRCEAIQVKVVPPAR